MQPIKCIYLYQRRVLLISGKLFLSPTPIPCNTLQRSTAPLCTLLHNTTARHLNRPPPSFQPLRHSGGVATSGTARGLIGAPLSGESTCVRKLLYFKDSTCRTSSNVLYKEVGIIQCRDTKSISRHPSDMRLSLDREAGLGGWYWHSR